MVIEVALRFQKLHTNVDIRVVLEQIVLDEHRLQDYLGVGMRSIKAHLVI